MRSIVKTARIAAALAFAVSACNAGPGSRTMNEAQLRSVIIQAANQKNIAHLLELEPTVMMQSSPVRAIYRAAEFYADPPRYRLSFVKTFPTDHDNVASFWALLPSKGNGFQRGFPYEALGEIAAGGDAIAVRKLMLATDASDGAVAEILGDLLDAAAVKHPSLILQQMARLPYAKAWNLAGNSYAWCNAAKAIRTSRPRTFQQRRLQNRVASSIAHGCP